MAINYKLKERGTGVTLYPETSTEQVFGSDGRNLKTVLPEMQERIEGKQDGFSTSEGLMMEDGLLSLTERAKQMLFDDMWEAAAGDYGAVDHTHVEDGIKKSYYLNGLWLTYEEAVRVYVVTITTSNNRSFRFYGKLGVRTNLPAATSIHGNGLTGDDFSWFCVDNHDIEVLNVTTLARNGQFSRMAIHQQGAVISNCRNLREIIGAISIYPMHNKTIDSFSKLPALERIEIYNLNSGSTLDISTLPKIDLHSAEYIVKNAWMKSNPSGATVIVHPDVYTKLADPENVEWHKVLTDALEKNITFATV